MLLKELPDGDVRLCFACSAICRASLAVNWLKFWWSNDLHSFCFSCFDSGGPDSQITVRFASLAIPDSSCGLSQNALWSIAFVKLTIAHGDQSSVTVSALSMAIRHHCFLGASLWLSVLCGVTPTFYPCDTGRDLPYHQIGCVLSQHREGFQLPPPQLQFNVDRLCLRFVQSFYSELVQSYYRLILFQSQIWKRIFFRS